MRHSSCICSLDCARTPIQYVAFRRARERHAQIIQKLCTEDAKFRDGRDKSRVFVCSFVFRPRHSLFLLRSSLFSMVAYKQFALVFALVGAAAAASHKKHICAKATAMDIKADTSVKLLCDDAGYDKKHQGKDVKRYSCKPEGKPVQDTTVATFFVKKTDPMKGEQIQDIEFQVNGGTPRPDTKYIFAYASANNTYLWTVNGHQKCHVDHHLASSIGDFNPVSVNVTQHK